MIYKYPDVENKIKIFYYDRTEKNFNILYKALKPFLISFLRKHKLQIDNMKEAVSIIIKERGLNDLSNEEIQAKYRYTLEEIEEYYDQGLKEFGIEKKIRKHSEETKRKIRESLMGNTRGLGWQPTEEQRKKMTKDEKVKYILTNIGNDYLEFRKQTKHKLKVYKNILNIKRDFNPDDLLSDVIFSVIKKLDDDTQRDRFYLMAKDNKLRLYIFKSIDVNCSSFKAPFLQSKINRKRIAFYSKDDMSKYEGIEDPNHKSVDSDTKKLLEMPDEKQLLIKRVYKLMEPEAAKELFGPHWKYFVQIFNDYMDNPKGTYKSISLKYNVPLSSIQNHLQVVYKKIRDKLNEEDEKNT